MNCPSVKKPRDYPKQNWNNNSVTLGEWLKSARSKIKIKLPEEHFSSLHALVAHVLEEPPHFSLAHPELNLSHKKVEILDNLLEKLISGCPLAYLTGKKEFWGLDYVVSSDVLIPRPETELLVENFIEWKKAHPRVFNIADVGTGSGCIGISLLKTDPHLKIIATDISFPAIRIASINAKFHVPDQKFYLINTNLLMGINHRFDCICANLPYIPSQQMNDLDVSKHEPHIALDGGKDGVDLISGLLFQAQEKIHPDGAFFLEIDPSQVESVIKIIYTYYMPSHMQIIEDYSKKARVILFQL